MLSPQYVCKSFRGNHSSPFPTHSPRQMSQNGWPQPAAAICRNSRKLSDFSNCMLHAANCVQNLPLLLRKGIPASSVQPKPPSSPARSPRQCAPSQVEAEVPRQWNATTWFLNSSTASCHRCSPRTNWSCVQPLRSQSDPSAPQPVVPGLIPSPSLEAQPPRPQTSAVPAPASAAQTLSCRPTALELTASPRRCGQPTMTRHRSPQRLALLQKYHSSQNRAVYCPPKPKKGSAPTSMATHSACDHMLVHPKNWSGSGDKNIIEHVRHML